MARSDTPAMLLLLVGQLKKVGVEASVLPATGRLPASVVLSTERGRDTIWWKVDKGFCWGPSFEFEAPKVEEVVRRIVQGEHAAPRTHTEDDHG